MYGGVCCRLLCIIWLQRFVNLTHFTRVFIFGWLGPKTVPTDDCSSQHTKVWLLQWACQATIVHDGLLVMGVHIVSWPQPIYQCVSITVVYCAVTYFILWHSFNPSNSNEAGGVVAKIGFSDGNSETYSVKQIKVHNMNVGCTQHPAFTNTHRVFQTCQSYQKKILTCF